MRIPLYISFLAITISAAFSSAEAAPIDTASARAIAARHLSFSDKRKTTPTPQLVECSPATYLFRSGKRFALVAADDRLPELLGYGETATDIMPPAFRRLQTDYKRLLAFLPESCNISRREYNGPEIAPLLTFLHDQDSPYNQFCPRYTADDGSVSDNPCIAGCVATALEQILSYHRRTYTLRDTLHGWTTAHYTIADILPNSSVRTDGIRDTYSKEETAAATECSLLTYWLGVAVKMVYNIGESGASTSNAVEPLKKAFGMGYVHLADSYKYAPEDWIPMLLSELKAGRPIYYAGNTMRLGGHAFVIDGINTDGLFHVNWGFGGELNGYFDIAILYSGEPSYDTTPEADVQGFFCNHEALFLHPDAQDVNLPDTLTRTGEEIVCTAWELLETPELKEYTPMRLSLRNTANRRLNTPVELFTNLPSDTAYFAQGDYIALTQADLQAGEERTLTVHLRFDEDGDRILRLSTDDKHYQTLGTVSIAPHTRAALSFDRPTVSFPSTSTATIAQRFTNTSEKGRSGVIVTYELSHAFTEDPNPVRHAYYRYLAPGETLTDDITFSGLEPGQAYRMQVRCPWTVVQTLYFEQGTGELTPLNEVTLPHTPVSTLFDMQGRRLRNVPTKGVFILNGKKYVR